MNPIRTNLSPLLMSILLALPAAPLWAVPVLNQQPAKARPAPPPRSHCLGTVRAELQTRDGERMDIGRVRATVLPPAWHDAAGTLPEYVRTVLHGNQEDLDTLLSSCRMADGETDKEARINDGVDVSQLLQQIDGWLELNRPQETEDEQALDDKFQLNLAVSAADHQLHAYLGIGPDTKDLGRLHDTAVWLAQDAADVGAAGPDGHPDRAAPAHLAADHPSHATPTSPVPEPGGYTLLLAGLGVIALLRRRAASRNVNGGKGLPAVRR